MIMLSVGVIFLSQKTWGMYLQAEFELLVIYVICYDIVGCSANDVAVITADELQV